MAKKKYSTREASLQRKKSAKHYKDGMYAYYKQAHLCTVCGKPLDNHTQRCLSCRHKINGQQRKRRQRASLAITDRLIDKGLITIKEAAELLGRVPNTIHTYYIRTGKLKVKACRPIIRGGDTYWVSEKDVAHLKRMQSPNLKCEHCGHVWRNVVANPTKCPKCQSKRIISIKPSNAVSPLPMSCHRLNKNEITQMLQMRIQGVTVRKICQQFKTCVKTFYKYWRLRGSYLILLL